MSWLELGPVEERQYICTSVRITVVYSIRRENFAVPHCIFLKYFSMSDGVPKEEKKAEGEGNRSSQ